MPASLSAPVARRLHGERTVVLGWTRAILLQLAHPLVAEAVAAHSTFRAHRFAPFTRLHATVRAMLDLTFGDAATADRAAAGIRAIHDRVHGTLRGPAGPFAEGAPYSAHDPALLLWVHTTLLESIPLAYELFAGPLTEADKDAYCAEAAPGAARLGVPPGSLPRDTRALRDSLDAAYAGGTIIVSNTARELANVLLSPPLVWLAPPLARLQRLSAVGTLPAHVRTAYGFAWTGDDARALARMAAWVRWVRGRTPDAVARFGGAG